MNGMQMMGKPTVISWEEHAEQIKISIANAEKNLLMAKAQLKEAEKHIGKD